MLLLSPKGTQGMGAAKCPEARQQLVTSAPPPMSFHVAQKHKDADGGRGFSAMTQHWTSRGCLPRRP